MGLVLVFNQTSFARLSSSAWACHFSASPIRVLHCLVRVVCGDVMDVFGDHAPCCHHGPSLLFRHNNVRDILGHAARGAGLAAVVIEKKNQIDGSNAKPGDTTVQQYDRGFGSSAFDVTITHPLQQKYKEIAIEEAGLVAEEAHDRKLQKSLELSEGKHLLCAAGLGVDY